MTINSDDNAVWWEGGLNVDADGSPDAYGPNNSGLDYTANAYSDHDGKRTWFGVVVDAAGHPITQGPDDPSPGKYISPSALQDSSKALTDPRRYVDSSTVRYLSIPRNAPSEYGIRLGDVGFAFCRHTGQMCAAIVADIGPKNKWGEGSMALARALDVPSSPRNGGTESGVVWVVFKGTRRGWPRRNEDIASQVQDVLNDLGGDSAYEAFIAPQS